MKGEELNKNAMYGSAENVPWAGPHLPQNMTLNLS